MAMAAQAIACGCSYNVGSVSSSPSSELRSEFLGAQGKNGRVSLRCKEPRSSSSRAAGSLVVEAAISREKKEATVEKARQQLEGAYLVAGIKYTGLTVKQFQNLRKALPETTTLIVAKNKLIGKAIEGTKWEALKPALKGMNAWLFVHTEEIPTALKPYRDMQKELKLENNDFTGAVFEGKFYSPEEFKQLETMPTRAEMYAKLLGGLQAPASNLVATLQAPARDVVLTLKAYVAKLEEQEGQGQA
ncbi:large subunit ribosomal protein L10 [Marchantia polymorpha subsp. ruderalis]|uniref:Large ribosomal subunit protein uL10c n=2 Tax=Marchantia polymorpha TaxID=3197 RepID=A0AAF6B7D5_MARPO|nr:hypothetical protein MARPO_0115s0051 [Marchantia polymorpha]BBN07919.1 hypothetical protein Mp_4g07300 [Marchantia polymorpha subsp. ruderalis]|eukprot:PTQ31135.1 hypothetical protein MARPO_0115s0051 [Marchantia polymorpha]